MKKLIPVPIIALILLFSGCATSGGPNYYALAKEKSFDDFFPATSHVMFFDSLDEAYDYVNTAQARFSISCGKNKAKGLSAKLIGPDISRGEQVTVTYFMRAQNRTPIDLSKIEKPLEEELRNAISATLVFMVFYKDRGVSMSNFHLQKGWKYNSNSQYSSFNFAGESYAAEYPVGWQAAKAFSYLRKEIN